jgi:hypothetical protein
MQVLCILWQIDPLLDKDLEINNWTRADAMEQRGKHASTTRVLLFETVCRNPLLGSRNSWTTTMERGVSMWSVPRNYLENWGDSVSCQLRAESCMGSCEERT